MAEKRTQPQSQQTAAPKSQTRHAIGKAFPRAEGRAKVTGQAKYTAEFPFENLCHAVLVQSAVAAGRVVSLDVEKASRLPGVVAVLTPQNMPQLHPARVAVNNKDNEGSAGENWLPLQDDQIYFSGQHLALVVAETLEQAQYAAAQVKVEYAPTKPHTELQAERSRAFKPDKVWQEETDKSYGDFAAGYRHGAVRLDATYTTAFQHHVTMEPHATIAHWQGDTVTIYEPTTFVYGTRKAVAAWLACPEDTIRVINHVVGGSFGCKGPTWPHTALTVIAARKVGRPVKLC